MKNNVSILRKNNEKYITFSVPIKKEFTRINKKERKSQKPYITDNNLLIVQDSWQAQYQIVSTILLKEFIKLNEYTNTMMNNVTLAKLNTKIATAFLNTQTLKMI